MTKVKVMNSGQLLELNKEAERKNYNRQLTDQTFIDIDPQGTHTVWMSMPHGDADHVRMGLHLKMVGSDEPVSVFLDTSWDSFGALNEMEVPDEVG